MFGAPGWIARSLVIVLAIGFVPAVAVIVAWVFELAPQGLWRDAEVTADESIAPHTARRMDRALIVALVCALGLSSFGVVSVTTNNALLAGIRGAKGKTATVTPSSEAAFQSTHSGLIQDAAGSLSQALAAAGG